VKQQIDLAGLGVPVIRPDLTAAEFKHGWRALPVLQRTMIICMAPVMAVGFFLFGTRRMLSRYANVDDLPDQLQSQVRDQAGEFEELIVDSRDRLLLSALDAIHDERCSESIAIAVVYGAGHMPAVVHHLLGRHGYRAREAEWLTVFPF
jgi:pheromone shutdown protein TraB